MGNMPTSSEEDTAPPPRLLALAAFRFPHGDAISNRLLQLARSATPPGTPTLVVNDWPADGTRLPADPSLPPGVRLISSAGAPTGRWRAGCEGAPGRCGCWPRCGAPGCGPTT